MSQEKWLCENCHFLLGYVEDKTTARIKHKDLYIEIKGGEITTNCRRCGKRNTIKDDTIQDNTIEDGKDIRGLDG